jgi:diguanylate cyclase (GGDEF)-like protein/PAS domain S-box-containing protein
MDEINGPTAIRLLILSTSRDRTEQISTSLRNGGLAVHSTRLANMEQLEEAIGAGELDLLLCCAFEDGIDLQHTIDTLNDTERDLPLLIISDTRIDPGRLIQAMREGARDTVDKDDLEHLQLVVAREFADLGKRRELEALRQRLTESEQRYQGLIESSGEPIAFVQSGIHVRVNPAYLELFGFEDRADVEDLPLLDLLDRKQHGEFRKILKELEGGTKRTASMPASCRRQDGTALQLTLDFSRASFEGEPGMQVIIHNSVPPPPDAVQQGEDAWNSSTDLPNRRHFLSQLDDWLEAVETDSEYRALTYLSIDDFHRLHAALGMNRCEDLMRSIADLLRRELTDQDVLARFGDNAFTLLCRRPNAERIESFVRGLCDTLSSARFEGIGDGPKPSCSTGVAFLTGHRGEPQDLINKAFNAADSAREQGGNQTVIERQEQKRPDVSGEDREILQRIDRALSRDRFSLAYQPIVSLQGDSRENYAVLVRMLDDDDNELLPETFIRQAEYFGKMVELDRWVIRQAIGSVAEQRRQGRKVNFFISLSEASLLDKNSLLWICDCLREFDARGGWLTFQIEERHARKHFQVSANLINGLKKIKCQVAIDHFGLQPRPESLLSRLKVDFVKLAPSFVRELNSNPQKQDELNQLNETILGYDVKTIATGVEGANSLTVLWTVGVSYIQGYFLQEPSESIDYGAGQQLT